MSSAFKTLDAAIAAAFEGPEPYRSEYRSGDTSRRSFVGKLPHVWDDEGRVAGIDWDAVRRMPNGEYPMADWSDSSGYSPRWCGLCTEVVVVRNGQFRILDCWHAGGKVATWGARTPYETSPPSTEDEWSVCISHPWAVRPRDENVDGPKDW